MSLIFRDGFVWGVATAAYQVEGAVNEDGRGQSIWDAFSHTPTKTRHGDNGDVACDQYHRYKEDADLMSDLGIKAYRFSVAWPRIQPDGKGAGNRAGMDHYQALVDALLERSISPTVTLYHWDLPQALQDEGGWANRDTAQRFADYAGIVFDLLGDRVPMWITLNEPWVSAWLGYGTGIHAPGIADTEQALLATHHLLLGHGLATQAIRSSHAQSAQVGITLNLYPARAVSDEQTDKAAAHQADGYHNRLYLDPIFRGSYPSDMADAFSGVTDFAFVRDQDLEQISTPIDFLGVNYYTRANAKAAEPGTGDRFIVPGLSFQEVNPEGLETTAMDWTIEPDGLTELLVRISDEYTKLPLYITENGCAFNDYVDPDGEVKDFERIAFVDAHLRAAYEAVERGVDLRGYFQWSFLDNFEWAEGYAKRFGIVFVDYSTQRRIPKHSARWYSEVIARNGLDTE